MEKLNAAQRDSQEKDQKCSKLEETTTQTSTLQTPAEPQTPVKGTSV